MAFRRNAHIELMEHATDPMERSRVWRSCFKLLLPTMKFSPDGFVFSVTSSPESSVRDAEAWVIVDQNTYAYLLLMGKFAVEGNTVTEAINSTLDATIGGLTVGGIVELEQARFSTFEMMPEGSRHSVNLTPQINRAYQQEAAFYKEVSSLAA